MQMYLWRGPSFRAINGGDDASILYHEYTHGLSNRLDPRRRRRGRAELAAGRARWARAGATGTRRTSSSRSSRRSTPRAAGDVHMGVYTDATPNSIRTQALDCPVGARRRPARAAAVGSGGYTYGDFGRIGGGPEVHYDGEIWAETLWDLRTAIGSAEARAAGHAGRCGCRRRSRRSWTCATRSCSPTRPRAARSATRSGRSSPRAGWATTRRRPAPTTSRRSRTSRRRRAAGEPRGTIAGRVTDAATGAAAARARRVGARLARSRDGRRRRALHARPACPRAAMRASCITAPGYDRLLDAGRPSPRTRRRRSTRRCGATGPRGPAARPSTGSDELAPTGLRPARGDRPAPRARRGRRGASARRQGDGRDAAGGGRRRPLRGRPGARAAGTTRTAAAADVRIETATSTAAAWTIAATPTFGDASRHRMNVVVADGGRDGRRATCG